VNQQAVRAQLESLLADLDRSAAVLFRERESGGETEQLDQHPADYASNVGEVDREEASIEVVESQRSRVRDALQRLEAGTYGQCVDCGRDLPDERLEARPEAERCVQCQQRYESRR
jgi:RNA polymerase-binding transcription factor DksA